MYRLHILKNIFYIFGSYIMYLIGRLDYVSFIKNIANYLAEINIFYVKFFQWFAFSIGNKLKNKEIYEFFYNFKDNVKYTEEDIDYESLHNLIDHAKAENKVITFDSMIPINSGSVALVFKATIDNKQVAVKLLRKNIRNKIHELFVQVHFIIRIMQFLGVKCNHLHKLMDDNKPVITEQCDFLKETDNIALFYKQFKKTKYVIIPKVYIEYTTNNPNIIVMDYIQGERLCTFDKPDFIQFQKLCHTFIITCCFFKDICHGDLHTGNIIFIKNTDGDKPIYKIGIIDYGICSTLNVAEQNLIANIMKITAQNHKNDVIIHLLNFIMSDENNTITNEIKDKIIEEYNKLYYNKEIITSTLTQYDFYIFTTMIDKYNIYISPKISQLIYSIISMLDTIHELEKTHNIYYPIIDILFKNVRN